MMTICRGRGVEKGVFCFVYFAEHDTVSLHFSLSQAVHKDVRKTMIDALGYNMQSRRWEAIGILLGIWSIPGDEQNFSCDLH